MEENLGPSKRDQIGEGVEKGGGGPLSVIRLLTTVYTAYLCLCACVHVCVYMCVLQVWIAHNMLLTGITAKDIILYDGMLVTVSSISIIDTHYCTGYHRLTRMHSLLQTSGEHTSYGGFMECWATESGM